ncbi:hypothetical protein NFO65_18490 [Neorhizobium galegae]|uniref:hypothetical protein n=1 Tax=Neorhizobium galegae TaxID=399 RepID=UPI0021019EE8|nr:hypothetical protein [Neorhizobium galegae]MCQ1572721.1 hypothetical protein [Neorhizobium galegae]
MSTDEMDLTEFEQALAQLPDGYLEGNFDGRRWGVTVRRSGDGRRLWLFGEELGGTDVVSFNRYLLDGDQSALKPCEMSSDKVIAFVLKFRPPTL